MKGQEEMTTMLDLTDQLVFLGERATGATSLLQCVWTYDRAIDMDGLRRFHHHLLRGRLSRHVERSPLPFGRHRWVSPNDAPAIEIAPARPREEFGAWLREQTDTPLDYEHGPAWHLAVLPFTDGGTGLSLVISHGLTDGVGLTTALADAASGRDDSISWPPAGSRRRWRGLRQDARQTVRDTPAVGRAIAAGARMARQARREAAAVASVSAPFSGPDEQIDIPAATVFIDIDEWDARARALGGTSNSLLAGFAAKFAQRVGRVTAGDGHGHVGDACQRPLRRRHPGQCGAQRRRDGRSDEGDHRPPRGPRRRQSRPHPGPGGPRRTVRPATGGPLPAETARQEDGRRRFRRHDDCLLLQPR